ncbi:hypothetical protein [Bradyrhizobium sp. CCBAU 51745]|uniref:hypothetical protein n=1 Tax=Bradyrhizobium sp. CCBAU 51745 TaxID=1325099 RepID=UPI0023053DA0|nr:hypothetical protein [Bradyrhizobium sp. CCBAU 51745]
MPHYIVRFFKNVIGDQGLARELCQGTFELDASSETEADASAKRKFCGARSTLDWSLHADRVETTPADFPS